VALSVRRIFEVKSVQGAVDDRREDHTGCGEERDATVERVAASEDFG
jgi:hypothetical protein